MFDQSKVYMEKKKTRPKQLFRKFSDRLQLKIFVSNQTNKNKIKKLQFHIDLGKEFKNINNRKLFCFPNLPVCE